jgi:hypothetical protein
MLQGSKENTMEARVDKLFAPWDRPDSPGCALGVVKDGRVIYQRGYGMANLEYDIPITERPFLLGSQGSPSLEPLRDGEELARWVVNPLMGSSRR